MTPSPLNVTVEQRVATFYCQHESSDDIAWRIDGTSSNVILNTSIKTVPLSGGGLRSSLSIAIHFLNTTEQLLLVWQCSIKDCHYYNLQNL